MRHHLDSPETSGSDRGPDDPLLGSLLVQQGIITGEEQDVDVADKPGMPRQKWTAQARQMSVDTATRDEAIGRVRARRDKSKPSTR